MLGFDPSVVSSSAAPPPSALASILAATDMARMYVHPSLGGTDIGLTPSASVVLQPKQTPDGPYSYRKEAENVMDIPFTSTRTLWSLA